MPFSAHNFREIYEELDIDITKLGCIMLDTDAIPVSDVVAPEDLHTSSNPDFFWIRGAVAESSAHVTLLYGLLKSGEEWRDLVNVVLAGWELNTVTVDHVGFFDTPYGSDEPYYCLVAHLKVTPELQEGNDRLKMLPHVDTFPGYKAHITLAYIKRDDALRDKYIAELNDRLDGKSISVTGLNYGGNH